MKLDKDFAEKLRQSVIKPDGSAYYKEIITQLKSSSIIAIISMIIAVLSLIVAIIALVRGL